MKQQTQQVSSDALAPATEILMRVWGYPQFRPGQVDVIGAVMQGNDVLAVLPTGGGKSICYQVPALARDGLTIVVSPLIALMQDQVAALRARSVGATFINSSLSRREVEQRWIDAEFGKYRLLYVAPERLGSEEFAARAPRMNIQMVAIDEAHCISEWGHHFRPEYRRIADALDVIERTQVVAVTATATPEVRADIVSQLRLREPRVIVRGFDRPNIVWSVFQTADRRGQVQKVLDGVPGSGIIYGATRRSVEQWSQWLNAEGITAAAYHGGMATERRQIVQDAWIEGEMRVIAATNAFGMGIDKPDVRFVIHDGIPSSLEAYYQEAGRGGRDGNTSYAVLLYQEPDRQVQQSLIDASHPNRKAIRAVYDTVASLAQVAVGAVKDDPVVVDIGRVSNVTGLAHSQIETSIESLVRSGVWERMHTSDHRGYLRMDASPDALRSYAQRQRPRMREFVETVIRSVDASAYTTWYPLDVRALSKRLRLEQRRILRGLTFLAESGFIHWCPPGSVLLLRFLTPRYARVPVDTDAVKRSRKLAQHKLHSMVEYAESSNCRRHHLLAYFGEEVAPQCRTCDICLGRHDSSPVSPSDEDLLLHLLERIAAGKAVARNRDLREVDLIRLLDWLEQQQLIQEDPAARNGYALTAKGSEWLS